MEGPTRPRLVGTTVEWKDALFELAVAVVGFAVMIVLAIVAFFVTVFVVVTGATLAGQTATGNFAVLAAAILVAAAILGGRASPGLGSVTSTEEDEPDAAGPEVA